MYPTSENFVIQMGRANRLEHLRGTIGNIPFDDNNIITLNYTNRNSDTSDISIGYCYTGQISASFVGVNIPRGSWRGKAISLEYGLEYPNGSIEWIPIGVFEVVKAEWTDTSITITANDIIGELDKPFSDTQTSGTIYDLIQLGCKELEIEFARTETEILNLPNGGDVFSLYPNNDIKTYRDYFGWISQLVGGYFTASRDGKLTLRSWSESRVVDSLSNQDRIIGSVFSDYSTNYSGISVVDIENKETIYVPNERGTGSVINLGSNPFLQFGTKETAYLQKKAIADVTDEMKWTPFQISVLNNPSYDLGDLITCTGGVAGEEILECCVMSIDWTFKQTTSLQGFGADPNLSDARSKVDKQISGLLSRTSENEVIFYTFENSQEFELGENEEEEIIKIRFATITPKTVNLWHEINLDVTSKRDDGLITCQVFYYLDDELLSYKPVTTWDNDGKHILTLLYFINGTEGGQAHEWSVVLKISGGTAKIDRGDIHASLYGQGLVASDNWNGIIEATEEYTLTFGGVWNIAFTDSAEVDFGIVESIEASDNYSLVFGGVYQLDFEDDVTVFTAINTYNWIDDNGDKLIDSDGDSIIFVG